MGWNGMACMCRNGEKQQSANTLDEIPVIMLYYSIASIYDVHALGMSMESEERRGEETR
jgi:hypothetical protein